MVDDVAAFDLQRFSQLPDRLAHIAADLEDAATELWRSDEPAGASAARAIDAAVGWVRREQARAAERWARIVAIPGFRVFEGWDSGGRRWAWDVDWVTSVDTPMHSYAQLEAIATYQHVLHPVVLDVERGDPVGPDEVAAALAALHAAADDPPVAASLLNLLGATGYRQLHAALAATAGAGSDEDDLSRLEAGASTLTAAFAAASHATGRHRLQPAFLDDLLGTDDAIEADARPSPSSVDAAQQVFTALDFSREVGERLASVTGPRGALVVLQRAGTPFAVLSLAMPLVELLQHGPLSPQFAESTITTSLGVAALLVEGAAASIVLLGAAAFVGLIFASADDGGQPRRPTRGGANPTQGTTAADLHLDDHGVPVTANGV